MVRVRNLFIFWKMNICFSSFTGASIARNDGMSVISVSYSTCLAHKVSDLGILACIECSYNFFK